MIKTNFYRPQRSWAKVMFLQASVILLTRGVSASVHAGIPPGPDPPEQTPLLRYDTIGRIELIPSIVLSSNNTNCKNDIQLFLQLFDELSVYRDYH